MPPFLLYGRQTRSLTSREEDSLRVCENRVARIFEPKREMKELNNEDLQNV
jgi:hypothetical protein